MLLIEKGFKEWFGLREVKESAIVKRILDSAGLDITDIIESNTDIGQEGDKFKGSSNKNNIQKRSTS